MATKKKDVAPTSSLPETVQAQLKELDIPIYAYEPNRMEAFLRGHITLGELTGVSKESQYQMAKVGHDFLREGKYEPARKVFEGLQALDPFDAYFHTALAAIAEELGDRERAERLYTRALEINPFSPVALSNRGALRLELGRFEDAVRDLTAAVKEDPEAREPSSRRARVLLQMMKQTLDAARADPEAAAREAKRHIEASGKGATKTDAKAATPAKASAVKTEPKAAVKTDPKAAVKTEPKPAAKTETKAAAKTETKAPAKTDAKASPAKAAPPPAKKPTKR